MRTVSAEVYATLTISLGSKRNSMLEVIGDCRAHVSLDRIRGDIRARK